MHYYIFSDLIFKDGQVIRAYNQTFTSEKKATIIDFKNYARANHAGASENYDAIIIASWQEIDEETYKYYLTELHKK